LKEVIPGVLMVERTWGCNVYFIPGENATMIDAGFPMDQRTLQRQVGESDESNGRIGTVVATHYHLDHVGSIGKLKELFGTQVMAHSEDAGVMEGVVPYERFKLDRLRSIYYAALGPLFKYEHVGVDVRLTEGDMIDAMGGLQVIHLPGHTRGSIALYQSERGILFSGDTIRNEKGIVEGPPPLFSPGIEEAFWCIKEKVLSLGFETLLPGHGSPVIGGASSAVEQMMRAQGRLE